MFKLLTEEEINAASKNRHAGKSTNTTSDNTAETPKKYDLKSLQEGGITPDKSSQLTTNENGDKILVEGRQENEAIKRSKTHQLDRTAYEHYMAQVRPEHGETKLKEVRAKNQSHYAQFGGFLNQAIMGEVIGGTVSAVGSLFEIPSLIYEKAVGETSDFNNSLIQLGQDIIDYSKDLTPIYRESPDQAFDIHDFAWWTSSGVSVASAASMLIPGKSVMSGMSWINKLAIKVGKKIGGKPGKAMRFGQMMSMGDKALTKQAVSALTMRHAENTRESFGVVNDVKQEMRHRFDDEEEWAKAQETDVAKELAASGKPVTKDNLSEFIASKAGFRSYGINFTNIMFDFIQAGALLKGNAFTRSKIKSGKVKAKMAQRPGMGKDEVAEITKQLDNKTSKFLNVTGNVLKQSTEGMEEAINYIGEKEGKVYGKQLIGDDTDPLAQRLASYSSDPHMWESAFWGAMGGVAFDMIGSSFSGNTDKQMAQLQLNTISQREKATSEYVTKVKRIHTGVKQGDITIDQAKQATNDAKSELTLSMAKNAVKRGTTNVLLEQLANGTFKQEMLNSMSTEELKEIGMNDIDKAIAHTIRDVELVEKHFNKYQGRAMSLDIKDEHKPHILDAVIDYAFHNDKDVDKISNLSNEINEAKDADSKLVEAFLTDPMLEHALRKEMLLEYSQQLDKDIEKATTKKNKLVAEEFGKKKAFVVKELENIEKLFDSLPKATPDNKSLKEAYLKRIGHETDILYRQDVITELLSDEGSSEYSNEMQGYEDARDKIKTDVQQMQFENGINSMIKDKDFDDAIAQLKTELTGRDIKSKEHKFIEKKIKELETKREFRKKVPNTPKQEETDEKQDGIVYDDTVDEDDFEDKLQTEIGGLNKADKFFESVERVMDIQNLSLEKKVKNLLSRITKLQADKVKKPSKKIDLQVAYIKNQIFILREEQRTDLGEQVGGIIVGAEYTLNGKTYKILSIHEDMNGKRTAIATKEGQSEEVYLPVEQFESLLSTGLATRIGGVLTETKDTEEILDTFIRANIKEGDTVYEPADTVTASKAFRIEGLTKDGKAYKLEGDKTWYKFAEQNHRVIREIAVTTSTAKPLTKTPITDYIQVDSFADKSTYSATLNRIFEHPSITPAMRSFAKSLQESGTLVNIVPIADGKGLSTTQHAAFDYENNTINISQEYLEGKNLSDLIEVLEHEMVHAELHKTYPYWKDGAVPASREEFNKVLRESIAKLKELDNAKDIKEFIDLLEKEAANPKGHPEELLTYLLTNQEFFDVINKDQALITEVSNLIPDGHLRNLFNIRKTANAKPASPNIIITKQARQLAKDNRIDYSKVVGTGVNGRITIEDIVNYLQEKGIKTSKEKLQFEAIDIHVVEAKDSNNLYLPAINAGIKDGKVDIEAYEREVKQHGGKSYHTQASLEKLITTLLSPDFNVNSTVTLHATKSGGVLVKYNGTIVGFVNSITGLERDLKFAIGVNKITNTKDLATFAVGKNSNKAKKLINWKRAELEGTSTNKLFNTHVVLLQNQLETATEIVTKVAEALDNNVNAVITTKITRKSSGNINQVESFEPVAKVMPHVNEVFYIKGGKQAIGKSGTMRSNQGEKRAFTRNPDATAFANHDDTYDSGRLYMLVAGANSLPGQLNSHIPVKLEQANISKEIADEAFDTMMLLVERMSELGKGVWADIKNDSQIQEHLNALKEVMNVTDTDKTAEDYLTLYDNKIEFNFGEGLTANLYFESKKNPGRRAINLQVTDGSVDKNGKTVYLPFKVIRKGENLDVETVTILNKHGKKPADYDARLAELKKIVTKAFTQKRHNVNYKLLEKNEPYKGHDTYLDYLLKTGVLTTDTRMLTDSKGKVLKDKAGNPVPAITRKDSNKVKNSNLIISIGTKIHSDGLEVGKRSPKKEIDTSISKIEDSTSKTPIITPKTIDEGIITPDDVTLAIKSLIKDKSVVLDTDNYANAVEDSADLFTALEEGQIVEREVLESGNIKLFISYDNSGLTRNKAVKQGDDKLDRENIEEVQTWWTKVFGNNVKLNTNIAGIIMSKGEEAWANFSNAMVNLSLNAPKGTARHEAFHVVFWLYNNEEQRAVLLKEAREKYGNRTNLELEERLADDFMDYVLKDGKTKKPTGKIKTFFTKIYSWIKNYFTGGKATAIDTLFADIDSGKFNYKPDDRMVEYAKNITRNKRVGDLTRKEEADVVSLIARKLIESQKLNPNLKLSDIQDNVELDPRLNIKRSLNQARRGVMMVNPTKGPNFRKVLNNPKIYNELYDKAVKYVNRQFGINIKEGNVNTDITEIDKEWNDASIFNVTQKDSVSNYVKGEIMTTPKYIAEGVKDTDTFLGLETYLDFNKIYPYIHRNMVGAMDLSEMLARMETMALHDPTFTHLLAKLNTDINFRAAWVSQFTKHMPDKDLVLYGQEGTKVDAANRNISHFILGDKWNNNIASALDAGTLTIDNVTKLQADFVKMFDNNTHSMDGNKSIPFAENIDTIVEETSKVFEELGIEVSATNIRKIIDSPVNQNYYGSPVEVFEGVILNNVDAVLQDIMTANKERDKDMEAHGMALAEGLTEETLTLEDFPIELDHINRLNHLAMHTNVYQYDLIESSYFDVKGNNVYAGLNPHYLSTFFSMIRAADNVQYHNAYQAKEDLLEALKEFASDPAMQYSNWLWATNGNNGALIDKDGRKDIDALDVQDLNMEFLNQWRYSMLDGVKNTDTGEGFQYNSMPDSAWEMTQVLMYTEAKKGSVKIPVIIPSDSGNISFISTHRIEGTLNGSVPRMLTKRVGGVNGVQVVNPLWQAVKNTAMQEIERMKAARDLMFTFNVQEGTYVPKEHKFIGDKDFDENIHVDLTKLEKNYYWKKIKPNEEHGIPLPVIAEKSTNEFGETVWKPTGNVFEFNNIIALNDISGLFEKGILFHDLMTSEKLKAENVAAIDNAVDAFIREQIKEGKEIYSSTQEVLEQASGYGKWGNKFDDFIAEFMLNNYISNVEQYNFLVGNQVEFAAKGDPNKGGERFPAKDINKRAKHISAPGVATAGIHTTETYKAATLKDIELKSESYEMIANVVADSLRHDPKYKGMELTMTEVSKGTPDQTKMNDLDRAVHKIVKGYLFSNTADAQGYVSVSRAKEIIKDLGRWNDIYENLFDKVEKGTSLMGDELQLLLQPFKGFYYGRDYNTYLKRHVSTQVKYSTVVLIPQLAKGNELGQLLKWMDKNGLGEVHFESAEKIGSEYVMEIADEKGRLKQDALDTFSEDNGYSFRDYQQKNWRVQLDVPDHMTDSTNKLGTQIAKIIIGNLAPDTVYTVAGDNYTRDEYIEHYMDVMVQNISEDGTQLLKDIGVEVQADGSHVITDMQKLSDILMKEVERRGISDNYMDALVLDEDGNFNMPLFINSMGTKWESILTSLFTSRVVDQKTPGGSGVIMSSAFIQPVEGVTDQVPNDGIQWSQEVIDRGDFKLKPATREIVTLEDGQKVEITSAEVLLPPWSKEFYVKDAEGNLVLDNIDNIPEELRTMVSYRIPTEQDYSVTVLKVVGFLPAANGSAIVLPEELVVGKGFDMDVDKETIMYHHFKVNTKEDGTRLYEKFTYSTGSNENTRESRDNRLLDIFIAKISNPKHFSGVVTPQSFEDGANIISEINDITGEKGSNLNPTTVKAQNHFRKQNIAGRALKGMAANSNAFLSVAQVSKMYLKKELGFQFKYRIGELTEAEVAYNNKMIKAGTVDRMFKVYNIEELNTKYGFENVTVVGDKFVTVNHRRLAWNIDGTYTNINGQNTMIHASQMLAMILDIVKEGVPFNVNTYTFSSFVVMLNTGVSMRNAGMFIRQPIMQSLSDTFFETQGFVKDERTGKEIEITKREYVTKLYLLEMQQYELDEVDIALETELLNGKTLNLSKKQIKDKFGINLDDDFAFDVQELKQAIKADADGFKSKDELALWDVAAAYKRERAFLIGQIKVLEMFKRYKKAGEGYDDMIKATGTDRTSVGPELTHPEMLNRQIDQANYYYRDTTVGQALKQYKNGKANDNVNVMGIGSITQLQELKAQGKVKLNDYIKIEQGARILIDVEGQTMSAAKAIFPSMFDDATNDSVYKVLEAYKKHAFDAADKSLSPLFLKRSSAFRYAINDLVTKTGLQYNSKLAAKVATYYSTAIQNKFGWFNDTTENRDENRVLGLDVPINTSKDLSIEEYNTLSTANKILYMQNKNVEKLEGDTHILNYLVPKTTAKDFKKNSMHTIEFINTKTDTLVDDSLVDSFQEMWDSTDEFESSLAKDLLYYSHLTTGFAMKKNSYSKLLPTGIFDKIDFNDFLYNVLSSARNRDFLTTEAGNMQDAFMRSHWNDSNIVPYVYTKWKKGVRGQTMNRTPVWETDRVTGILKVSLEALMNEDSKVVRATYITVPIFVTRVENGQYVKGKIKDVLYKRYKTEGNDVYFVPVDKLGNKNIIEFGPRSVIKANQTEFPTHLYEQSIETGVLYTANDPNVMTKSYNRTIDNGIVSQGERRMFMDANAFIGDGGKMHRSDKFRMSFGIFANMKEASKYDTGSMVMVSAPTVQGTNAAAITKHMFDGNNLKGVYKNIYTVFSSGGTVMLKAQVTANGKKIMDYGSGQFGNGILLTHLDKFVKDGNLFKKIEKDVAYYSKEPFDGEILSNEEKTIMKNSDNYNPNNTGCL